MKFVSSTTVLLLVLIIICQHNSNISVTALNEELLPVNIEGNIEAIRYMMKTLTGQTEQWNTIFLTILEPRIHSMTTALIDIENKVNILQEKANSWDNFQLHISAWNAQLATIDKKADIINDFQEKILSLETKMNSITKIEYKANAILERLNNIDRIINTATKATEEKPNYLFGEFATRGILGTLKSLERKTDQILLKDRDGLVKNFINDDTKLDLKCSIPRVFEEVLNDISLKVNVLFKMENQQQNEIDFETENYNTTDESIERIFTQTNYQCLKSTMIAEETFNLVEKSLTTAVESKAESYSSHNNLNETIYSTIKIFEKKIDGNIESIKQMIEDKYNEHKIYLERALEKPGSIVNFSQFGDVYPEAALRHSSNNSLSPTLYPELAEEDIKEDEEIRLKIKAEDKHSCEELSNDHPSAIYTFGNNIDYKIRNISHRFCEKQDREFWTVIQRRGNYHSLQNFNLPWLDYKQGFGDLSKDFWFGNDFIHKLTMEKDMILRIELEDFEGNMAWSEYFPFKVMSEEENYRLYLGNYSGNATDSFSGHNNSLFSTYDKKNDLAPECCPCAVSYEGGWWFNSCFECNLNGAYHRQPKNNEYLGIIWQHWLGDYSLKKSKMMIKPKITELVKPNIALSKNYFTSTDSSQIVPSTMYPQFEEP